MMSVSNFKEKVLQVVREIPVSKTMSYKEVAMRANAFGAARAVGTVMRNNFDLSVPCHRVVCSDGSIGQYNRGGKEKKIEILKSEGVKFIGSKVML